MHWRCPIALASLSATARASWVQRRMAEQSRLLWYTTLLPFMQRYTWALGVALVGVACFGGVAERMGAAIPVERASSRVKLKSKCFTMKQVRWGY